MRPRTRLGLVVFILLAVSLTPLGLAPPASAAVPRVGQCHQLTWQQGLGMSDTRRPVRCTERHNLQTVAVLTAPVSLDGLTDDEIRKYTSACFPPVWRALGRRMTTVAQTAYELFTFVPTPERRAAGARWIRCDLALLAGPRMLPLPRHRLRAPIVPRRLDDHVRRCLTGRYWTTSCERLHAFRSIGAFVLDQEVYPSRDRFISAGTRRCPRRAELFTWPSEAKWTRGQHVVVCYDRTHS